MSEFLKHKIGPWTITTHLRDQLTLRSGEVNVWAHTGGEIVENGRKVGETPYRKVDIIRAYWSRSPILTQSLELEAKVSNGEVAGVRFSISVPKLMRVSAKVGAPRKLIRPWVLSGREFAIELGSYKIAELRIAHEDDHMRSYYLKKIKRGEPRPDYIGRWALIPGIKIGWSKWHWANLLFGKATVDREELGTGDAIVPMPEGSYPATWTRERLTWRRGRVPFPLRTREDVRLDLKPGIPVPGKGENSWDCDDDAVCGTGGRSVADAIGNAVGSALRQRSQYAGPDWTPTAGWPEEIGRNPAA